MNRGMNTSPVQTSDEKKEEIKTTTTGQKTTITQTETPEETLQPESLETEDTGIQNMEENEVPDADDTRDMQVQDGNIDSQVNGEEPDPDIPDDQTLRASQDDNY